MRRTAFALLLTALVASACSGSGGSDTTAAVDTTAATAVPADTTSSTTTQAPETTTTAAAVSQPVVVIDCLPGSGPNFTDQDLSGADFADESLECATFDGAVLSNPNFRNANLPGASFVGASISQGTFQDATLIGADFTGAELAQVRFNDADLTGAILADATLTGVRYEGAICPNGASATGSCDGNLEPAPVEFVESQVEVVLAPIEFVPLCEPDSGPDFSGQELASPEFRGEDLRCADFTDAVLSGANFGNLDASGAVFDGATISQADFSTTKLFGASFDGAAFAQTKFEGANLIGADITNATFTGDRWSNTICPNGVNSEQAGGTCLGSRNALDLPEVDFDEITAQGITVRQGDGVTTYTVAADVLFDFDSAEVGTQATVAVEQVIASIEERFDEIVEIQVWGHADAIGDTRYNLNLSQERADNVAALIEAAFAEVPVVAIGLGEAQPIAPNTNPDGSDNPDGRALNRRVEVVVRTG